MRSERGQSTVEWIALVLLAALLLLGLLLATGGRLPGVELARAVLARIVCAAGLEGACEDGGASALAGEYGSEVAALVRAHSPDLIYEPGMVALPVDFRSCRKPACSDGARRGLVERSASGEPVLAFTHVVDCRADAIGASRDAGYECSGEREGNLYVQYYFYYPTSSTAKALPGKSGFHLDDWESFGVRIEPSGTTYVRASSHHGYNYAFSALNSGSDAGGPVGVAVNGAVEAVGGRPRGGWGPDTGRLHISGGSHAGNAERDGELSVRSTPGEHVGLVPIESLNTAELDQAFAVVPPWLKAVYRDPESNET